MSNTETLLQEAADIARRVLGEPSEMAVLDVFHRLCVERDGLLRPDAGEPAPTVH